MNLLPLLGLLAQTEVALPQRPPADTVALLRRVARRAEAAFERIARQRVPVTFASYGRDCDEIVGRFCLTYDSQHLPEPAPEAPEIVHARRAAVEALRQAFTYAPEQLDVTGPLVRYLVEDGRAGEAVSAARAFLLLSNDTTWGSLLLGFALHAAGDDTAAARLLDEGVSRLDPRERERIEDVGWVLSYDEQRVYRRLDAVERARYNETLWRLSDPLFLTPNERRNAHLSRHVWSRILARAPVVADMVRWGRDLEQLTVRYGTPTSRMRALGHRLGESSIIERFDPDHLAYTPEDIRGRGMPPPPLPGEPWPLDNPRARSGYAPTSIRGIVPLEHQVSRFPVDGGIVLRVDARFALDSVAAGRGVVDAGLFVLDSLYAPLHETRRSFDVIADTAVLVLTAQIPNGPIVYSAEALEPETRYAGRARYALERVAEGGLLLSDLVVTAPFGEAPAVRSRDDERLRPLASLIVPRDAVLGLFAEVSGLAMAADGRARYRVEITRQRGERSSLPAGIVAWIGRRLGIGGRDSEPRVAWTSVGDPAATNTIAVDVALQDAAPGLYIFELAVTDLVTGQRREVHRPVRVD